MCLPGKTGHLNPKSSWASLGREGGRSFWSSLWNRQPKLQWLRGTESGWMCKPGEKYCYGVNCGEEIQVDVVQALTFKVPSPPLQQFLCSYLQSLAHVSSCNLRTCVHSDVPCHQSNALSQICLSLHFGTRQLLMFSPSGVIPCVKRSFLLCCQWLSSLPALLIYLWSEGTDPMQKLWLGIIWREALAWLKQNPHDPQLIIGRSGSYWSTCLLQPGL